MDPVLEQVFTWTGRLAMLGWLAIAVAPGVDWVVRIAARLVIPVLIAVVYAWALFFGSEFVGSGQQAPEGAGFGSLAGVRALFTVDSALLAGWVHYLAFDLFVGTWEVEDSRRQRVPHLLVLPCLVLTLMLGPLGLAAYLAVRGATQAVRARGAGATI